MYNSRNQDYLKKGAKEEDNYFATAATQKCKAVLLMCTLPGSHLRHLVCHLTQCLRCANYISALLPCTKFTNFSSLIKNLPDGLLTCVP